MSFASFGRSFIHRGHSSLCFPLLSLSGEVVHSGGGLTPTVVGVPANVASDLEQDHQG